ncbi:unnamed protein product, partial [Mesorhabditis belari]|uniref:HDAg domain-containing protein n=1 Tax=Mesorhabditis belari TaxID=2138241 RepID=A0AAF3EXJ1_9BILA
MESYTPRTAASAPGTVLKDNDLVKWLEKKLGDSGEGWEGRNAASFLSKEMLEELETCFQKLETNTKVKLLTAIPHIQHRLMTKWRPQVEILLNLARRDADDWVEAVAEFYRELPQTSRIVPEPSASESHFYSALGELKEIVKRHAEAGDIRILPPTAQVMSHSVLKQQYGIAEAECEKHFTLRRKPRSHLLKMEVLKQAEAAANPIGKSKGSLHGLPICKVRSTARKPNNDLPMTKVVMNTCKLSAGFSNEPKKFQRPALKREGGAKLLDISEIPQSMKKRKIDVMAEERKRKADEKEEMKKKEKEEKEARIEEMKKRREEEKIAAEKKKAERFAMMKAAKVTSKSISRNPSLASQSSGDEGINKIAQEPPKANPKVTVDSGKMLFDLEKKSQKLIDDEERAAVRALTPDSPPMMSPISGIAIAQQSPQQQRLPHGGLFQQLPSEPPRRLLNQPQKSPLLSPTTSASPMQSPSALFQSINEPAQQRAFSNSNPNDRNSLMSQPMRAGIGRGARQDLHTLFQPLPQNNHQPQQQQQRNVPLLQERRPSSDDSPQPQQLQYRLSHMTQPPPAVQTTNQNRIGQQQGNAQPMRVVVQTTQPQQQQRLVQPIQVQLQSGGLFQTIPNQQTQNHQRAQQQQQQQQQQLQNAPQMIVQRRMSQTMQPLPASAQAQTQQAPPALRQPAPQNVNFNPDKNDQVRRQCEEMLRTANRLDQAGRQIVLDFMCGNKVNPRPDIGHIITIKLSETIEDGMMESGLVKMRVETFFQMDFSTGEWKRLRKCKLLTDEEMQQVGFQSPQQQQNSFMSYGQSAQRPY